MTVSIVLIPLLAVLAPLAARGLGRWVRVPVVVFELVLGIIAGPSILGWAQPHEFVHAMSQFGVATLFFVAGGEIEMTALRGRTGRRATLGWFLSIGGGVALGWLVAPGDAAVIIGIALASTTLGTLVPILRDAGELKTPFGHAVGALGAVGEFGPLIAISLFLGGRDPGAATIVLAVYALIAVLAVLYAFTVPKGALHTVVGATLHTSAQFAIRVMLLILGALVTLSLVFGVDMLLGAFTAGIVWRLLMRDADTADREVVESKVEAIAFGFLVPIFFIYTGVTFDLRSLLADPLLLVMVPVVAIALLVVRGLPSMLAAPVGAHWRDRCALGLMGAAGLPIIVAVTQTGVSEQIISTAAAAVLVGGGMLSVLVFPLIAMALRGDKLPTKTPVDESV